MCIYISMSIIEKVFHYGENELSVIKFKDEIWFKAKQVALLLSYLDPGRSIRRNVDPEDKIMLERPIEKGEAKSASLQVSNLQGSTLYLNESGLYCLIFGSKLKLAKSFKRHVTKVILPTIRRTGRFSNDSMIHKYNKVLTFRIFNETDRKDLHVKVVSYIKKNHPHALMQPGLGELQDNSIKRLEA